MMTSINNTLGLIENYWSMLIIIIALVVLTIEEVKKYKAMTREQRIEAALSVVKGELLKLMSDAEIEWSEYKKSGALKKSQVLKEIYTQFPFLQDYINQDELVTKITEMIDAEMENMNKILKEK